MDKRYVQPIHKRIKKGTYPLENMLKLTLSEEWHAQQVAKIQRSTHLLLSKDTHD